jgi:hypothetical protein
MFVKHAFVAERFTTEAVFIETLLNEASVDRWKLLVTFVRHAFIADRFTMEAIVREALSEI